MKTQTDINAQSPQEILSELRSLVIEAEKILGNDTSGSRRDSTVAALRERLEAAQERLANFYEEARQKVAKGARVTDEAIRANPYQSLAIALGVGLAAGVLIGRTTKK